MKSGNRPVWKRIFYSPVGIVIGLVAFVLIVRGAWNVHEKAIIAGTRLSQAQAELASLQSEQQSLSASISQLSSNAGIEAALREKYHAVKQGESVAVIVDGSTSGKVSSDEIASSTQNKTLSWWESVLQFIGL